MERKSGKYVHLYYFPTGRTYLNLSLRVFAILLGLFVLISSMSYLIPPSAYPARYGLLVTSLLVLVNMFNSVLTSTPSGSKLFKSR